MKGNVRIRRVGVSLAGMLAIGLLMFDVVPRPASARAANLRSIVLASVIYVDAGAAEPGGDGSSWANAFLFLQDALDVAVDGDEILVAGGPYYPDEGANVTPDDRAATFSLLNGLTLKGGYRGQSGAPGNENVRDETTTLSGDIDQESAFTGNSLHVVDVAGEDLATVSATSIDGFTITAGSADGVAVEDERGGALRIRGNADVTVTDVIFKANRAEIGGGAVSIRQSQSSNRGLTATFEDCQFNDNEATDVKPISGNGGGGALEIRGTELGTAGDITVDFTRCSFDRNKAPRKGGAVLAGHGGEPPLSNPLTVAFTDCTFDDNETTGLGGFDTTQSGAVWLSKSSVDFTDCTFRNNVSRGTGGNTIGGGAIMIYAYVDGLWQGCTFIGNTAQLGGAIYGRKGTDVEVRECLFVDNTARDGGGGAICLRGGSAPSAMRICQSDFISNHAFDNGGAVYNHTLDSTMVMVNCIVAGNNSGERGGGSCNANLGAVFELHNCLIAGNDCDGAGDLADGGGHGNRGRATSELIHCTVVGNHAASQYGGVMNVGLDSKLKVRNCIMWDNSDGDGTSDALDEQLFYADNLLLDEDVDKNVIDNLDLDSERFVVTGGQPEENKGDDPDVVNTTTVTWINCSFDPATGKVTFDLTHDLTPPTNQTLFQPEAGSPLQLLISGIIVDPLGDERIVCYGWWDDSHGFPTKTGTIYDYHIATGSSAIDYGDAIYLDWETGAGDKCDLDGNGEEEEDLPYDLDPPNGRNQGTGPAPDAGAYEVPD